MIYCHHVHMFNSHRVALFARKSRCNNRPSSIKSSLDLLILTLNLVFVLYMRIIVLQCKIDATQFSWLEKGKDLMLLH